MSQYQIIGVFLQESHFEFSGHHNVEIQKGETFLQKAYKIEKDKLQVVLTVAFKASDENAPNPYSIKSKIVMLGVFKPSDLQDSNLENFANINAPAIIYPFVREHLATLTAKAGVSTVMLMPVNFVALNADSNK